MLLLLLSLLLDLEDARSRPLQEPKPVPQVDNQVEVQWNQNPETLEELLSINRTLVEGDILLLSDRNAVGRVWPTRDIPYEISPVIEDRTNDILAAMAMISTNTCVTFHQRTRSETDFLFFNISRGCASYVGFIGGKQSVSVATRCIVGNIAHEILHALGFHHEHTRLDRNQYITIIEDNIIPGMKKNFQILEGQTFNLTYDYKSILHYGSHYFSSNGKPTIIPKKDTSEMGQRDQMTELDIQKVRNLYHCDSLQSDDHFMKLR